MSIKNLETLRTGVVGGNSRVYPESVVRKALADLREKGIDHLPLVTYSRNDERHMVGGVYNLRLQNGKLLADVEIAPEVLRHGMTTLVYAVGTGTVNGGVVQDDYALMEFSFWCGVTATQLALRKYRERRNRHELR